MRYWKVMKVRGPTLWKSINGGPREVEPFGNLCEAFANLFDTEDPTMYPSHGVYVAVGYTPTMAIWNCEFKLKQLGYNVEEWEDLKFIKTGMFKRKMYEELP